jgi:hypothetical protein
LAERASLRYVLNNTRPVELLDLTGSLLAIGEQYRGFVRRQGQDLADDDYRLYVREVKTGSIIIDLVSLATQPQFIAPFAPFLVQFTKELADWFDFFKGIKDARDIRDMLFGRSRKELQQLSDTIEPAAKDAGSTINITASEGAVIIVNSSISSTEANAGQMYCAAILSTSPHLSPGSTVIRCCIGIRYGTIAPKSLEIKQ